MNNIQPINRDQFIRRLTSLCLRSGLAGMPKDVTDQHILLKSVALIIKSPGEYTEQTINEKLQIWLNQVCPIKNFDRVTLRRWLVDTGYIHRSSDGKVYQLSQPGPQPELFDTQVDQIDILETIRTARDDMERRKNEFLKKSQRG